MSVDHTVKLCQISASKKKFLDAARKFFARTRKKSPKQAYPYPGYFEMKQLEGYSPLKDDDAEDINLLTPDSPPSPEPGPRILFTQPSPDSEPLERSPGELDVFVPASVSYQNEAKAEILQFCMAQKLPKHLYLKRNVCLDFRAAVKKKL